MKKILLLTSIIAMMALQLNAQQYPYIQNFDSYPTFSSPSDWTHTVAGFQIYPGRGVGATQNLTRQFYNLSTSDSIISPLIGPISGSSLLTFSYRIVEYIGSTPLSHSITPGDKIEIKVIDGSNTTTVLTIDQSNHADASSYAPAIVNLSTFSGDNITIMIKVTWSETAGSSFFVDIDDFNVENFAGVNEANKTVTTIQIYPNPVSDILNITASKEMQVKIFDAMGKVVKEQRVESGNTSFSIADLSKGIYSIQSAEGEKSFREKVFIKQ